MWAVYRNLDEAAKIPPREARERGRLDQCVVLSLPVHRSIIGNTWPYKLSTVPRFLTTKTISESIIRVLV